MIRLKGESLSFAAKAQRKLGAFKRLSPMDTDKRTIKDTIVLFWMKWIAVFVSKR